MPKTIPESFGEILFAAEAHGFIEPPEFDGEWSCEKADALELLAIDFLQSKGFTYETVH